MKLKVHKSDEIVDVFFPEDENVPKEEKVKFRIKPLSWRVKKTVENMFSKMEESGLEIGNLREMLFKEAVKGWENIQDDEGKDLPFNFENLMILPYKVQNWLVDKINAISGMSVEDVENLG